MQTEKVLLDTDIGGDIDDAVCLAYLLCEPRCALLGITTVCGDAHRRAAVADAICRAAGKPVPVFAGHDRPLQPIDGYPLPEGAAALERWPHGDYTIQPADAVEFLYRTISEHPGEVTLIAIGNLTNVAALFQKHPDSASLLKGLSLMNGYFGAAPLPELWYNWNAWADPLAAKIVYDTPVPCHRTLPLEITEQLTIPAVEAEALLPADSDLMRAVYDFGSPWLQSAGVLTLHDPLAAVSVFHQDVCRFTRGRVTVETENTARMAATIFSPDDAAFAEVAAAVDRDRFYRILADTLNGAVSFP